VKKWLKYKMKTTTLENISHYYKMKKKHFIIGLIIIIVISLIVSLQIQVQEGNKGKAPAPAPPKAAAPAPPAPPKAADKKDDGKKDDGKKDDDNKPPPVNPVVVAESLKIVESIMNGKFTIDPITDADYLGAVKTYKCFIPPGTAALTPDYSPFSGNKPKNTYTLSESVSANDKTTKKFGLIPSIVINMLPTNSFSEIYPYQPVMEPLVFYTAYIVKLQTHISAIVKSKDKNAQDSLLKVLQLTNFIYDDGKKQFSIQLDQLILYINSLLGNAFNTGKYKSKIEADFLCNYNTTSVAATGILQKSIPLLLADFSIIGFSTVPASMSVIEASPLNGTALKSFIKA